MKAKRIMLWAAVMLLLLLSGCGGEPSAKELPKLRELSWKGTELTVRVGSNQTTGCEWKAEFEDDSIIGYSINRKFHPIVLGNDGQLVGYSDIGFEGKSEGTAKITLTTPCDWDGTGEGYKYVVTVTVKEDGTIETAEGS